MTDIPSSTVQAAPPRQPRLEASVALALAWQALLGLASLAAAAWLARQALSDAEVGWLPLAGALAVGAMGVASLGALPWLRRRDHRGRVVALVIDYLVFVALFFYDLHVLGIFTGIDKLAGTFARGLPFLALVVLGFLVRGRAGRAASPTQAQLWRTLGNVLMLLFALVALVAMGLFPGLRALGASIVAGALPLTLTVGVLLAGLATWFWWRTDVGLLFNATIADTETLNGYLLLSPNLLGFLVFFAGPLLFSLYVSFTEWSAFGDPLWIGIDNYRQILSFDVATLAEPTQRASEVLAPRFVELTRFPWLGQHVIIGAKDKLFWIALRNTLLFCALVVPLSVIPALLLANVLNSKIPGMKFFRAVYFIPSVAAVVGVAVIWNWLFNSTVGFINYGITQGIELLNALPGVALTDPQLRWLSSSDTALLAIVIMTAWRIVGFNTVLFLAGLQGIPSVIYEAAEVDGASTTRKFWSITLPLLAPTTFFVVTTTVIQALQVFDEVFVLMNPPAGPNNSTLTAVLYLYQNGFQRFNLGYASAVAWVLFAVIFVVTLAQFRLQRSGADAY